MPQRPPGVPALAQNIRHLISLATTPDEKVGLLQLFGPRVGRLFDECKVVDHSDVYAAVKAYGDILPIDATELEPPLGPVVTLIKRCRAI